MKRETKNEKEQSNEDGERGVGIYREKLWFGECEIEVERDGNVELKTEK